MASKRLEPGAGQVDEVTGHLVDEVGQQRAEGGAADRPAVDEQHVGSDSDPPVGGVGQVHPKRVVPCGRRVALVEQEVHGGGDTEDRSDSSSGAGTR